MSNTLTVTAPEGQPAIDFVREFDAPPAAVFRAHQDPELVAQWLGPHGYEMVVEEWDFRDGGRYRYIHKGPDGEYGFHGVFHSVRPDFSIQTFEFEGMPDIVSMDTLWIEDLGDGRTRLRGHSVFPSVEARDGMVVSGMERGMSEGYDRLDGVLTGL